MLGTAALGLLGTDVDAALTGAGSAAYKPGDARLGACEGLAREGAGARGAEASTAGAFTVGAAAGGTIAAGATAAGAGGAGAAGAPSTPRPAKIKKCLAWLSRAIN